MEQLSTVKFSRGCGGHGSEVEQAQVGPGEPPPQAFCVLGQKGAAEYPASLLALRAQVLHDDANRLLQT